MMRLSPFLFLVISCLLTAACQLPGQKDSTSEPLYLRAVPYAALTDWRGDVVVEAFAAFEKSCQRILKKDSAAVFSKAAPYAGTYADWQPVCRALPAASAAVATGNGSTGHDSISHDFFERYFTPYEIWGGQGRTGLFTGYYEPSLTEDPAGTPLYARPDDLITADLGAFREDLKGESLSGRIVGQKFVPYPDRKDIERGPAAKSLPEILRVDDPIDAFFLHIQGSGQVIRKDGTRLRLGYAAQNGHAYYAIGRDLVARGALTKEEVSMQSIRRWLAENPDQAEAVMHTNPSFVFFRILDGAGPLGAEGVALTPTRSLAVDRRKFPYGAPVFLDAETPDGDSRMRRLLIAQDTGGAIRGSVRGDVFWGAGDLAAEKAGMMKSRGRAWILLPKTITVPKTFQKRRFLSGLRG